MKSRVEFEKILDVQEAWTTRFSFVAHCKISKSKKGYVCLKCSMKNCEVIEQTISCFLLSQLCVKKNISKENPSRRACV